MNGTKSLRGKQMRRRKSRPTTDAKSSDASTPGLSIWERTEVLAIGSAIILWLSFSPIGTGLLGWLAPLGWLQIAMRTAPLTRRDLFWLWISGALFWLVTLQGIRLAYWPLYFGWIALSLYLAVYTPLFVLTTRLLMRRGASLVLAAPLTWVGLEYIRSYMLSGYCANMLGHSQARFPIAIQLADQLGVYGVSACLMTVACCIILIANRARTKTERPNRSIIYAGIIACILCGQLGYGWWRLRQADELAQQEPLLRVGLIQENTPTMFDMPNDEGKSVKAAWLRYQKATQELAGSSSPLDLVVWPESTFTAGSPWVTPEKLTGLPESLEGSQVKMDSFLQWHRTARSEFEFKANMVVDAIDLVAEEPFAGNLLVGCDIISYETGDSDFYNGAILANAQGKPIGEYRKMHLVMFGEYLPLGPLLQWLRDMFGLIMDAGDEPKCFQVNGVRVSPNICFESMMPRVISGQVRELVRNGQSPQVLVNLTNDSWFHGSSMLKHHLDCTILNSVENRRPILVAANSGFSAELDGSGRLLQSLGIYERGGILAQPKQDSRPGLVQTLGYPFAFLCASLVILSWIVALLSTRKGSRRHREEDGTVTA